MKKEEKNHSIISLMVVLTVVAVGTGMFINASIKNSLERRQNLMVSLIDRTVTEEASDLTVEQWKISNRNDKLRATKDYLLETTWKDTELDNITLTQLNSNRAFLVDLTDLYLAEHGDISPASDIRDVFIEIRWLQELSPEVYKDQYEEYKKRMAEEESTKL